MMHETIARLIGILDFKVNPAGLQQFQNSMSSVSKQMQQLAKQAEALNSKLALKMGIKPADTAAQAAAQKSVIASLDRELKLERLVAQAKRETFKTELAQSKLQFTGNKAPVHTLSNSLQFKQAQAVADAKQYAHKLDLDSIKVQAAQQKLQHASTQASLKVQGLKIKNESVLEAAKARQLRSEKLLQLTQAKTQLLQQKQLQSMAGLQKLEQSMTLARERANRQADNHQRQQQRAHIQSERQQIRHAQQMQRFDFAKQRHERWLANQRPKGGLSGMLSGGFGSIGNFLPRPHMPGFGGFGVPGVGSGIARMFGASAPLAIAAAPVAGLVVGNVAAQAHSDRIKSPVIEAEKWDLNIGQVGGKNKENQERAKKAFLALAEKYGTAIDLPAAEEFKKFMLKQQDLGVGLTDALKKYETQQAAFTAAGLDKTQQQRAAYQIGQITAKGKPEGSDINDLFDAAGAMAPFIRQAAADRLGFKGDAASQVAWFKEQVSDGGIIAADLNAGMGTYVAANAELIKLQQKSIAAEQQRIENDAYLRKQEAYSSVELQQAMRARLSAERDMAKALEPITVGLINFHTSILGFTTELTKFSSFLVRLGLGNDDDKKPKQDPSKPVVYPQAKDVPPAPVAQSWLLDSSLGRMLEDASSKAPMMTMHPDLASLMPLNSVNSGNSNITTDNSSKVVNNTINITAPANTDTKELSDMIDYRVRESTTAALQGMLGAARALQAERQ